MQRQGEKEKETAEGREKFRAHLYWLSCFMNGTRVGSWLCALQTLGLPPTDTLIPVLYPVVWF